MKPFQQAVIDELVSIAEAEKLDVLSTHQYANVGRLIAKRGLTSTVATVSFQFSPRHNIIQFNDAKLGDKVNAFLLSETDDEKLAVLLHRWKQLVKGAGE